MTANTCKTLTIFEGPDGGGKTTLAQRYAELVGARYVHFGPLPHVQSSLARTYVEAMMPALLGHQDVVLDRSWLSETIYGTVFREGHDRLGKASVRMLERLAMRCGAVVVKCMPSLDNVVNNYQARKNIEMLDNIDQLVDVYHMYEKMYTSLPRIHFDYNKHDLINLELPSKRMAKHKLHIRSAGNCHGLVALVGDQFGAQKNEDPFYQWPFASFSRLGCSQWLSHKLHLAKINEADLFWVNADQDLTTEMFAGFEAVIALGGVAYRKLLAMGLSETKLVNHPQHQKRFGINAPYDLIKILEEQLH